MERDFMGLNQKDYSSLEYCKTSEWAFSSPPHPHVDGGNWNGAANKRIGRSPPSFDKKMKRATMGWFLPNSTFHKPTPTNLLRNNESSSQLPSPMTIFYSGYVHVYNDVSPEMAGTIFSMAGNGSLPLNPVTKQTVSQAASGDMRPPPTTTRAYPQEIASAKFIAGALTMARKATLARFLLKRKHRLQNGKPYNIKSEKELCIPPDPNFLSMSLQEEETGSSNNIS